MEAFLYSFCLSWGRALGILGGWLWIELVLQAYWTAGGENFAQSWQILPKKTVGGQQNCLRAAKSWDRMKSDTFLILSVFSAHSEANFCLLELILRCNWSSLLFRVVLEANFTVFIPFQHSLRCSSAFPVHFHVNLIFPFVPSVFWSKFLPFAINFEMNFILSIVSRTFCIELNPFPIFPVLFKMSFSLLPLFQCCLMSFP